MNMSALRVRYPEHRDLSDEALLVAVYRDHYDDMSWDEFLAQIADKEAEDRLVPLLEGILDSMSELKSVMSATPVYNYEAHFSRLQSTILELANAVSNMEPPVVSPTPVTVEAPVIKVNPTPVTVEAPIVKLDAPVVNMPEIIIPGVPEEWTFSIQRDRNGYIQGVVAKAGRE